MERLTKKLNTGISGVLMGTICDIYFYIAMAIFDIILYTFFCDTLYNILGCYLSILYSVVSLIATSHFIQYIFISK